MAKAIGAHEKKLAKSKGIMIYNHNDQQWIHNRNRSHLYKRPTDEEEIKNIVKIPFWAYQNHHCYRVTITTV